MARQLLSLGSINADFHLRIARPLGSQALLLAHDFARLPGGKAANVALLAQRLGHAARLFGRVGDDDLAGQALEPLRDAGVDTAGVRCRRGSGTGLAIVVVPPDGRKQIVLAARANLDFDEADIEGIERGIAGADSNAVLVANYEVAPRAVSRAIAAAHARAMRVVVDPSLPQAVVKDDLRHVAALTPNESEARALAGIAEPGPRALEAVARTLASFGPPLVCIKLDAGGCLLLHEGSAWHQYAAPAEAIDTTGAGDAFTGALAVALLEGRPPLQAVAFAVAASEIAVGGWGAQPSYPDRRRLDARLRTLPRRIERWGREPG
jgi:ribokinase